MNLRRETPRSILAKYFDERARQESIPSLLGRAFPQDDDDLPPPSRGCSGDPYARWEVLISMTRGCDAMGLRVLEAQHRFWAGHEVVILEGTEDDVQSYDIVAVSPSDKLIAQASGLTVAQVRAYKHDTLQQVAVNLQRARGK